MAKLTLSDTTSGYNRSTINANFSALEAELQNKVFYRDNPTGEPNQLENSLDMNSFNILNGGTADFVNITVNGTDLQAQIDAAAASATAAATSESNAATSETNAATSEANALASFNSFQSIYYGSFASEPATDPLGNAPTQGDLYYNSTDEILYIRDGGVWINFAETEVAAHEAKTDAHPAANITYDNTTSGLTATDVKEAIDEVDGDLDGHLSSGTAHASEDITYDNTLSGSSATDVKGAVDDIYSQIGDIGTTLDEINGEVI